MYYNNYMIYGNIDGIKRTTLEELENLCENYDKSYFIDRIVLDAVIRITSKLNREISVFISRGGRVLAIGVGDSNTVPLAHITQKRGNKRFNGVRCIHTHPNASGRLSNVDISALKSCRFDCIAAVGVSGGYMTDMQVAYIRGDNIDIISVKDAIPDTKLLDAIELCEGESVLPEAENAEARRCLLVHVSEDDDAEYSLNELDNLARTMGLNPIERIIQHRDKPDRAFYVGSGKVKEVELLCQVKDIEVVIFDHQLSGVQLKNLQETLNRIIIDRSILILDIFAKHATTNEGKLQIELAKLRYQLPMLTGQGIEMSRQRGGLYALGGGGETKLELDRRNIRRQITALVEKLQKMESVRDIRRQKRKNAGLKSVVIVGYTNAGKSTLMNYITKAGVLEEDKLFATLDSVGRTVWDEGNEYLLVDTVGFINRLPHEFIDAFKSTLDEARYADLLLHVVDKSSPYLVAEFDVVMSVLNDIGADKIPLINVYNKNDKSGAGFLPTQQDSVTISARTGEGVNELKELIKKLLFQQ
ncbi:MAG: GTPase HflX [Clostridia bacterium]|nr:GTPase HflX [Clostridia bacterium]